MNHFVVDGRYEDLLKYCGLDPEAVLKKAQLPEDIFRRKSVTMKEGEYYRFMEAISKLSTDSQLPIRMSTMNQIESFSPPIFASWCSRNDTTFQKQLNNTREILAIHYIRNTDMTTNDMAYLLGYAELNSFLRAFTVWTGKTITEYRKEMEKEEDK